MATAHKRARYPHIFRIVRSVERQVHRLANRHPFLAVALALVMVVLCVVVVLVRVVIAMAVKTVTVAVRLTIVITLVVCRNIFRTFPT